jgi:GGDEF domain-containing protein
LRDGVQRLLLVEDNPGDARLLREMFDERPQIAHNTTLTVAQTCREAERCLSEGEVDVVLLDLGLPDATGLAVLFMDLDGFKHINDSLGHAIGDKLLQSIAKRLVACVRRSDTVSRQGGDEFVVLLSEVEETEGAAVAAGRIVQAVAGPHFIDQHELHVLVAIAAGSMLEVVAKPHPIDHHDLYVTASIGVSIYPDDGMDADTLIQNADIAMYQAKEDGRQGYRFFEPEMNARAVERQFIEESLAARGGAARVRAALPADHRSDDRGD